MRSSKFGHAPNFTPHLLILRTRFLSILGLTANSLTDNNRRNIIRLLLCDERKVISTLITHFFPLFQYRVKLPLATFSSLSS